MSLIIAGEKIKLFEYLCEVCETIAYTDEWRDHFWERLLKCEPVYREFLYWADHKDFLLDCKVGGNTIIDILVWEMRKFNVRMDRGRNDADCDKYAMVLEAFDEMLRSIDDGAKLTWSMEMRNGMDEL